jgi:hypothetical protein
MNGIWTNLLQPRPEILTKYNLVLQQVHTLFRSLSAEGTNRANPLPNLVIHPPEPIPEGPPDLEFSSLLRMMRLPSVLAADEVTAAKFSQSGPSKKPSDDEILTDMAAIRDDHDARVERGLKAVQMLRDQYNWKIRVQADEEEIENDAMDEGSTSSSDSEDMFKSSGSTPHPLVAPAVEDDDDEDDDEDLEDAVLGKSAPGETLDDEAEMALVEE